MLQQHTQVLAKPSQTKLQIGEGGKHEVTHLTEELLAIGSI